MAHLATVRAEAAAAAPCSEWIPYLEYWNYREGEQVDVVCYTNLSRAELFLNGESLGIRQKSAGEDGIRWQVPFHPGTLSVHASGSLITVSGREGDASDQLATIGAPCILEMQTYRFPGLSVPEAPFPAFFRKMRTERLARFSRLKSPCRTERAVLPSRTPPGFRSVFPAEH